MDYWTIIESAAEWVFSDVSRALWIAGAIAVIGAINGVRLSLGRCSFTAHCGRKVL